MVDILTPSSQDDAQLAFEVNRALIETELTYRHIYGVNLVVPITIETEFKLFRAMLDRQTKGDCRSTESERKAVKVIAQWTLDTYRKLRGQQSTKLEWR